MVNGLYDLNKDERWYLTARLVWVASLAAFRLLGLVPLTGPNHGRLYAIATGTIFAISVMALLGVALRVASTKRILMRALPFDLVALTMLVVALHEYEDPMYPVVIGLPVIYALVYRDRRIWLVGGATTCAWLAGHWFYHPTSSTDYIMLLMQALVAVVVSVRVAASTEDQRVREEQLDRAREQMGSMAGSLQQRVAELQAVSQTTEIIHSTLDFETVGPLVLDVVKKLLGLDVCSIFVIDRNKDDTLFTATAGVGRTSAISVGPRVTGGGLDFEDEHLTCMTVVEHHDLSVVFCCETAVLESLSEEDRIVLAAISSELAVAVENSQLYKLTRRLAITDELTGAYNYRYFQERLEEEVERARRYRKDLSLLMIDTDDFKAFNDKHGHMAGDVALSDLVAVLRRNVREVDMVARYGGEEFAILLPETDAPGAFVVAEKLRDLVARFQFADEDGDRRLGLTVSIGLATFPVHATDREQLIRLSDDSLFVAKTTGRNRVRTPRSARATGVLAGMTPAQVEE